MELASITSSVNLGIGLDVELIPSFFIDSERRNVELTASWERKGLDLLLVYYPTATLIHFDRHVGPMLTSGPWVSVTLDIGDSKPQFGIWKETGAVYHVDQHGACADDPFLVPEGSPYDGPIDSQ